MQCDICGKKKATVHLTEIVDEQMSEMHLCEECARQKSVQMEQQFGLADLLAGLSDFGKHVKDSGSKTQTILKCSNCGLHYEYFRKLGRLGCGECYTSFKEHLDALLKKIHGSNRHLGKAFNLKSAAKKITAQAPAKNKTEGLDDLRRQLQDAIHHEDFEKAAQLRDRIREMEKGNK